MSTWIFEPGHTEVAFRARHMMVTWVRGLFKDVHGQIEFDLEHCVGSAFSGEIDAAGVWTGEADRDAHLRSADFTSIGRFDFGVAWQGELPRGGVVVGREVELVLDVQAIHLEDLEATGAISYYR